MVITENFIGFGLERWSAKGCNKSCTLYRQDAYGYTWDLGDGRCPLSCPGRLLTSSWLGLRTVPRIIYLREVPPCGTKAGERFSEAANTPLPHKNRQLPSKWTILAQFNSNSILNNFVIPSDYKNSPFGKELAQLFVCFLIRRILVINNVDSSIINDINPGKISHV